MPQKKRTTSTKTTKKHRSKKPKVYIPAYKIIILCASIITICMALLLVTTVKSPESSEISQRFENEKKNEQIQEPVKIADNKKSEKKAETKKEEVTPKKTETSPVKKEETKPASKPATATVTTPVPTPKPVEKKNEEPKPVETKPAEQKTVTPKIEPAKKQESAPAKKSYNFPQAKNGAQLVFVFDDGGQNLNHLKPFLELPFPITIAVLPRLTYSAESARRIRASGKELMLHQPMQAVNSNTNPGPGAIKPEMSESEIISTLFYNINEIGPIAGFNNHEGSAITANAEQMEVVMRVASENGVFFLDSRTNKDTQVPYVAKEMGYSYYERNGNFLDNEKTKENALKELRLNLDIANKTGSVIMIGHIWSADFLPEFLMEVYPELKEKGYTFTTVTKSKAKKY